MKRIFIVLAVVLIGLSSCNIGEDGLDGDAYLRMNWTNEEPSYIETGGVIPSQFEWDTYYKTRPGVYNLYYEYTHTRSGRSVVDYYEADVEIWVVEGECGRTHNRDGRDANEDVFFDLNLWPNGEFDFEYEKVTREESELKSYTIVHEKELINDYSEVKDGYGIKYSIYKLNK